jgi:hypothetical protein
MPAGDGPNVTYWTAGANGFEPNVSGKVLPAAAIRGDPFPDVVCLSATHGLLLGCSSTGQLAIWDIVRCEAPILPFDL